MVGGLWLLAWPKPRVFPHVLNHVLPFSHLMNIFHRAWSSTGFYMVYNVLRCREPFLDDVSYRDLAPNSSEKYRQTSSSYCMRWSKEPPCLLLTAWVPYTSIHVGPRMQAKTYELHRERTLPAPVCLPGHCCLSTESLLPRALCLLIRFRLLLNPSKHKFSVFR